MSNQYYTFIATFRNILGWIDGYAKLFPPPAGKHLRYKVEGPEPTWPGNAVHWFATVLAHSRWQPQVTLLQIGAVEENGRCRVSPRCLDPNSESWYRAMVDVLVPDDAEGDAAAGAHPLPELRSPGATKEPAQALPAPGAPAPPPAPAPVEKDAPYVPKTDAFLREWKAIWNLIKPLVRKGKSSAYIEGWLLKHDDDHHPSKKTIAKIIKAGEAGLLD